MTGSGPPEPEPRAGEEHAIVCTVVERRGPRLQAGKARDPDLAWALTSWQLWEQLVIEQGWSKELYGRVLGSVLRTALIASRE